MAILHPKIRATRKLTTAKKNLRTRPLPMNRSWTGLFSVQGDGAGKKGSVAAAASEKQQIWMAMGNGEPV